MTLEDTIRSVVRAEVRAAFTELCDVFAKRPDRDRYLSVAKAAEHAEVHPDTVRAWLKARELPVHHAGRELRVKLSELEAFLAGRGRASERTTPEEEAEALPTRQKR